MRIIDVDAHFEPTQDWLDGFPELRARMPALLPESDPRLGWRSPEQYSFFTSFDLLRFAPREQRLSAEAVTTDMMRAMYAPGPRPFGFEGAAMSPPMDDPGTRLRWMDAHGIAAQNLISGTGYTFMRAIEDPSLQQDAVAAVNTWMSERTSVHPERVLPVTSLSYFDLDWAVRELGRMRARGSRAFLFNAEPVGDVPPTDRSYDRLWSAATDLGMIPLVHVGLTAARFHPAWANVGDPFLVRALAVSQPHQAAVVLLTGLVLSGVFERHPKLTFLFAELGVDWLAPLAAHLDGQVSTRSPIGDGYSQPLAPSEYIRRNVRITPLPHPHQSPLPLLERLPEVAVFSTDMPHFESNPDAVPHYQKLLAPLDAAQRASFLGGSIRASYALMGDPLPAPSTELA
jgi:predicted TIM-barrel fold metal-dependent hydrolase